MSIQKHLHVLLFLVFGPSLGSGDVLVLKDGQKVSGKVVGKSSLYEVTGESGLRTYLKEEVDRVVTSPKEFLGDSDRLLDEAKREFQKAVAESSTPDNARIRDVLGKVTRAREAVAATRELFPEDKHAELDQKLMQIMQLLRLCRDRLGSELARRPAYVNGRLAAGTMAIEEAFAVVLDPAKRADAGRRASAHEAFRLQRTVSPEAYDVATAAMLYLSRSDEEWRLKGASLKVLQGYFQKAWFREVQKTTPTVHLEAAHYLADQVMLLRKADPGAAVEPLSLFGMGHLGHAPPGAEADNVARLLGLTVQGGVAGTPEGHVVRDLSRWIAAGDFDLAVLAWVKEFRSIDTPITRFVWSYALLRLVQAKKRGFERPVAALGTVPVSEASLREHVAGLVKSIKAVAVCSTCSGEGKLRCTNCQGRREVRYDCVHCKGTGKIVEQSKKRNLIPCYPCRGRGFDKLIRCEKCKEGYTVCRQCDGKEKTAPDLSDICEQAPCAPCEGRGYVYRNILWACRACMGVGQKLTPKADPSKVLP